MAPYLISVALFAAFDVTALLKAKSIRETVTYCIITVLAAAAGITFFLLNS